MTHHPNLVSLFAGIGGFDLAFTRQGYRTVGMCEIDPHAQQVLRRHWPTVPLHDDVTTLTARTFDHPDVITFGSPCQDLSVAGQRAGMDGERSGLFTQAIRYIREVQEATRGAKPTAAVWENVPGAYSSRGGDDFAAVLAHLVGGDVRPPTAGWPHAGVAFGPLGTAEWRTLDAQHFGVPQRRQRIFLVYRPRATRAGDVLLESARSGWDPPQSRTPGPTLAGTLTRGLGSGGPDAAHALAGHLLPETSRTVTAGEGRRYDPETGNLLPTTFVVRGGKEGGGKGFLGAEDCSLTLTTKGNPLLARPVAFDWSATAQPYGEPDGVSPTMKAGHNGALAVALAENQRGELRLSDQAPSLGGGGKPGQGYPAALVGYRVRRLTPRECERLQGFPDDHTALDAAGHPIADSHRYRMCGNAIAVPVGEWVARRLLPHITPSPKEAA